MELPFDAQGSAPYRLPEEILLQILTSLDASSPSARKYRWEPSLQITDSRTTSLKTASCVSKQWRRLTVPLLFKYARLNVKSTEEGGSACTGSVGGIAAPDWHVDGTELLESHIHVERLHINDAGEVRHPATAPRRLHLSPGPLSKDSARQDGENGMLRLHRPMTDFLRFVEDQKLAGIVESFVLATSTLIPEKLEDRFPHHAIGRDWRYRAAAVFWNHLLALIEPDRIVIVAPPTDLAALTNCAIDTFGDWAFSDMDFHILELQQDRKHALAHNAHRLVDLNDLDYTPHRYPGLARSSVFNLRPWSHVSVNEGSFLKAYGTYEFFERGPPSLVYSIKDCLTPRPIYSPHSRISDTPLASLRSFTYTAIFPFASHLAFQDLLPQLEELDLQLAPGPQSNILDSKERRGKAELDDCWSELITVYQNVAALLATFTISEARCPKIKRFVCRDMAILALQDDLNKTFVPLCLPVWAEYELGVFVRLAMSAEGLGIETEWQ